MMLRFAGILIWAILGMVVLADSAPAGNAFPDNRAPDGRLLANSYKFYEDPGLGYSLSYPKDWRIWPHHAGAILSPSSDPRASSCTLLVSREIGVPEQFELDPAEWTALMRSSVPGYQLIESKPGAFSETPVTIFFGSYKGPDGSMKMAQAEAVKRNTLYSLECTAPAAMFDKHRAEMESILASLQVSGAGSEQNTTAQSLVDYRDYSLRLIETPSVVGSHSGPLRFEIVDDRGELVRDFELVHERLLHLFVVRKDLAEFQHLHPQLDGRTGTFTLPDLAFPSPGDYRLIAEFMPSASLLEPGGGQNSVTVHDDIRIAGDYRPELLRQSAARVLVNGYEVALRSDIDRPGQGFKMLMLDIAKDGKPVKDLEDYLGALGHAVILHEGDLRYTHVHPMPLPGGSPQIGEVMFHVAFPEAGLYRAFFQFQHRGVINTAVFTFDVPAGSANPQPIPHQHGM